MIDDERLTRDVLAAPSLDPSVIAQDLGVAAKDGSVTLTGHVASFARKHAAEAAARRVNGVEAIAEEIPVELSFDHRRTDEDLAAAATIRVEDERCPEALMAATGR